MTGQRMTSFAVYSLSARGTWKRCTNFKWSRMGSRRKKEERFLKWQRSLGRRTLHRHHQVQFPSCPALQHEGCRMAERIGYHYIARVLFGAPQAGKATTRCGRVVTCIRQAGLVVGRQTPCGVQYGAQGQAASLYPLIIQSVWSGKILTVT